MDRFFLRLRDNWIVLTLDVATILIDVWTWLAGAVPGMAVTILAVILVAIGACFVWPRPMPRGKDETGATKPATRQPETQQLIVQQPAVIQIVSPPQAIVNRPMTTEDHNTCARSLIREFILAIPENRRCSYFYGPVFGSFDNDEIYQRTFEALKADRNWGWFAHAVDEWVTLGLGAIVKDYPGESSPEIVKRLYRAALDVLQNGSFPLERGKEFAGIVYVAIAHARRKAV